MPDWRALVEAVLGKSAPAQTLTPASLTARTPEQQRAQETAWWLWRHCFLEAQRLRLLKVRAASAAPRLGGSAAAPAAQHREPVVSAAPVPPVAGATPAPSAETTTPPTQPGGEAAEPAQPAASVPPVPGATLEGTPARVPPAPGASQPPPVAPASPAVSTAAVEVLAAAFEAGQQEPVERTPIAGTEREPAGSGPARTISLAPEPAPAPAEPPSRWPAGPGLLSPRVLEQTVAQLLDDDDVRERGVTKNKLKSAGAGSDAEALLAWLDAAEVLAPSAEQGVPRWRTPRPLAYTAPEALRERLAATPLPDAERVAQVRAAFGAVVPIAGLGGGTAP